MPEKREWRSEAEVTKLLTPFLRLMESGMPDSMVAEKTRLTERVVCRWRLKQGIKRTKGLLPKHLDVVQAISGFGESLGDLKQRTKHSAVLGAWVPPAFLRREHVDYNQFLRVLDAAHRVLGMTETQISRGLGITLTSVEQGLAIYQQVRHQSKHRCQTCNDTIPEGRSLWCSALCQRLHVRT